MPEAPAAPDAVDATAHARAAPTGAAAAALRWLGPLALALLFASLTLWSWRRWGSPRIDHGQQLYMAWQIASGRDLVRDIAWVYGPLSPYLNGALFRLFGVSYTTLIVSNLTILAGLCVLLYRGLVHLADRGVAFLAIAAFLPMFAFAHLVHLGNYNFITPYTHDATHGTVLCFGLLACVVRANERDSRGAVLAAGLLLGGAFLTKPEIILAAGGTALWGLGFPAWLEGRAALRLRRDLAWLAAGLALALGAAFALLALRTSPGEAAAAIAGPWAPLWGSEIGSAWYFQEGLGLDAVGPNLLRSALATAAVAAMVAALVAIDPVVSRGGPKAVAGAAVALFAGLSWAFPRGPWKLLGSALPGTTLLLFALFALQARAAARARDLGRARRLAALSAACVLALGFLSKMLLNSRLHHYGFFLAVPATGVLLVAVGSWLPARLRERRPGGGRFLRAATAAVVLAAGIAHWQQSRAFYERRQSPFGRGGDLLLTQGSARGNPMQQTLERIRRLVPPGDTFVAMPYGIMLNYQARRRSPAPYMRWTGLEFIVWGEDVMRASLERTPPDWIVLVHSASQAEFRLGPFGRDPRNGKALVEWVHRHYETVERIGAEPFTGRLFGAKIMRRRDESRGPGAGRPRGAADHSTP